MSLAAMSKGKSKITNQPEKLSGIDNRSTAGRRRRDLIRGFMAALGGPKRISAADISNITRAADLVCLAEQKRADALRGVAVDTGDLVRLENSADRAVRRLGIRPTGKPSTISPLEYAAQKAAAKAAGAAGDDAA